MSATNRGAERKPYDFYATPIEVVYNLLNNINLNEYGNNILEPSAGNGNICFALKSKYSNKNITSVEIRPEEYENLIKYSNKVIIEDYFNFNTYEKYDVIIGNPPYSLAKEFIEKSFKHLADNGVLIFLLRTAFLESKSRYEFWQKNPLNGLYSLSKRPSFTGKGTDATSYSWFIWDRTSTQQVIKII